jgi:glucosamine 6-phosphate synthetase-like amidotransferase/phosphosugar isomerase protein
MCGLFGFTDTKRILTQKQVNRLTSALATASAVRGTDATGIAYNTESGLKVFKRPLAANKMRFKIPGDVHSIMGHVRMTTQGSEKKNRNNHPFIGTCGATSFSLAHNGVLQNDLELRKSWKLPKTHIETDSYVAVQLLEKLGEYSHASIATMAEALEGSFTLTLLDDANTLAFVKGNNPLALWHFVDLGLYVYASTEDILLSALHKTGFIYGKYEELLPKEGDILRLTQSGDMSVSRFDTTNLNAWQSCYDGWSRHLQTRQYAGGTEEPADDLLTVAEGMGYSAGDIWALLDVGYGEDEIAELLYDPKLFEAHLTEMDALEAVY